MARLPGPRRLGRWLPSYWGWRIAWALAVTQTVGYGVLLYAFGVFTLPMETELGWSRAQTSGAFSLALLLSGIAAVPVGVANGASTLVRAGLVADAFGPAHYGSINGSMTTLVAVLQTVAPLGVGAMRVAAGGYDAALWALAGVALLAAGAVARAEAPAVARSAEPSP